MNPALGRGLREIVAPAEKAVLPAVLERWGYVRGVLPGELDLGLWFAYGDDGLFWLIRDGTWEAADEAQLHLCAAPAARGRIASRWALVAIEVVACLVGVRVLHAPCREEWEPLLRRVGWWDEPRGPGPVRWLARTLPPRPPIWTRASLACEDALGRENAGG